MKRDQSNIPWMIDGDNVIDSIGYFVCETRSDEVGHMICQEHNLILKATGQVFDERDTLIGDSKPFSEEELEKLFDQWHQVNDWRIQPTWGSLGISEARFLFLSIRDTARLLATLNQVMRLHTPLELLKETNS